MGSFQIIGSLWLLVAIASVVQGGPSGLNYQAVAAISQDAAPETTTLCAGPTNEYQAFSMVCPQTTLLSTALGQRGLIRSIPQSAYARTGSGQLTMACPSTVPTTGGSKCYCNPASALQTRCQGFDRCDFTVDNAITGCDPCPGHTKTLISLFNCAGLARSLVWSVHQASNALFWTTSSGVYRVPSNNAADTGLTRIINFTPATSVPFQTVYNKAWTFNSRLYVLATLGENNDGRVFEFTSIPTSSVTINTNAIPGGQRTAIVESGPFFAVEHVPFSDANGVIWTSSATVLRPWTRTSDWVPGIAWTIPNDCAGSRCFDFYRGSSLAIPTLYDSRRFVAFGGTNGRIVVVDSADTTLSIRGNPQVLPAGAGIITCITWAQIDGVGYLVFGSSLGIVFQYDFAQRRIANIAVVPSPIATPPLITGLAYDSNTNALFAAGGDNSRLAVIYRVRITQFSLDAIDFESLPAVSGQLPGGARAMWIDVARNRLYVGADQPISTNPVSSPWNVNTQIYSYSIARCNYTCSECGVVDPSFCGWCAGSASCELIQAINSTSCPLSVGPFTQPGACPVVTSLSRTTGSLTGGTLVGFVGANFFSNTGAQSLYTCTFGASQGTVVSVSSTQVTCRAPAGPLGTVSVGLTFRGTPVRFPQPLQYQYINCAALDCDTCFSAGSGDCVWCHQAGSCSGASACTGPFSTATCPAATAVSNAISVSGFVNNFTISATQLNSTQQYRCNVGGATSAGTLVNNNAAVRCQRPGSVSAANVSPFLEIFDGSSWNRFTQPRASDPVLEIYDCTSIPSCFSCINNRPDCAFCTGTGLCSYDTATCSRNSAGCPRITGASVSNVHYSADNGTAVALTISATSTVDETSFQCIWKFANGTEFASVAAVPPRTQTSATCIIPRVTLSVPQVTVEIWTGSSPHTNPYPITVYDCTAGTRCSICESSSRPKCTWCNSLLTCEATSALPGGVCPQGATATCPSISITPNTEPLAGGRNITVTPSTVPGTTTGAVCAFRGPSVNVDAPATWTGSNFLCAAPRVTEAQVASLALIVSGTDYATPVSFEYFDCAFASANVPRSCSDCLSRSGCGWCGGTCAAQLGGCAQPLLQCPVITGIVPAFVDASASETVEIFTNPLPPPEYAYDCIFGSQRSNAAPSPNGLRCQTPVLPTAADVTVQIATRTNFLGLWSTDAVAPELEFYKCSDSARQCGPSCFASSPYCGYCLETGQCSGRSACQRIIAVSDTGLPIEKVWFNSSDSCPTVSDYGPKFMQAALPNRQIIRESLSFSLANVELPVVNLTGKRNVGLSRFGCQFGADNVPVSNFDPATKTFTCQAPVLRDQGFYSLAVTYQGNRINNEGSARLQVQDCFSIPACGLCLLQPNCGWCRGSVRCMTKAWCDAEPITEFGLQCPAFTRVSPATSVFDQTAEVTVTGGPFVNSSLLEVRMEYTSKNRTIPLATRWVSASELSVTIPASIEAYEGEVRLSVWMNGTQYVPSDLAFIYLAPSAIIGGVQPAAIGGIVAAAIIVILILIGALFFMRSRKVGFFSQFKLKEPDYALVAFSSMLQPQWRQPKDNWEILAIKLLAKDHGFVFSIMATTPPTEQDKISRALCHVYEWHKKSVEYGVLFVTDEVSRNKEENTIFRNNSMASKWFKFYCKIIGIKYLFDHLARFIYELNKISEIKGTTTEDTTGGKSLLSLEMEVDPNKFGNDSFTDSEANVYQLILACQKVFTAFRTSIDKIPPEFKEIFSSMRESIVNKFKSDDAVLKAVGGFFFLRFACPAMTAPHAYGLLENPPNESCQRQLVLIGKVIQNLANMTMPGAKETFMLQLNDFFSRNIPKMRQFYNDLLGAHYANSEPTEIVSTPDIVRVNGLGFIMEHIHLQTAKLKAHFEKEAEGEDERLRQLNDTLTELIEVYPKKPRKAAEKDDKAAE